MYCNENRESTLTKMFSDAKRKKILDTVTEQLYSYRENIFSYLLAQ